MGTSTTGEGDRADHRPRLQLTSVTIGAHDPRALAAFYARLLDTEVHDSEQPSGGEPPEAGWAQVRATSDRGSITVNIEHEAHWQSPVWPAQPGHPVATQHLDIHVDDLAAATDWALIVRRVERLGHLGANQFNAGYPVTVAFAAPRLLTRSRTWTSACCSTRQATRSAFSPKRADRPVSESRGRLHRSSST